jgi:hypothetical protein
VLGAVRVHGGDLEQVRLVGGTPAGRGGVVVVEREELLLQDPKLRADLLHAEAVLEQEPRQVRQRGSVVRTLPGPVPVGVVCTVEASRRGVWWRHPDSRCAVDGESPRRRTACPASGAAELEAALAAGDLT